MTHETRIALFLLNELVSALRANDPDTFKRWLSGGVQDFGEPAVEGFLMDWLALFLNEAERDRLVAWHLGVSLQNFWGRKQQTRSPAWVMEGRADSAMVCASGREDLHTTQSLK